MEKLEVQNAQPKAVATYNEDKFYAIAEKVARDIYMPKEEMPLLKEKAMSFYLAFKQTDGAEKCSRESIESAFRLALKTKLDLGEKSQAYLITYGTKLTFQISYRGMKRLALEANPNLADIRSQIIYEGDTFIDKILPNGKTIVVKHERPSFEKRSDKIVGGYGIAIYKDGSSEIFEKTLAQILKAWSKSRNGGQAQKDFAEVMTKRTLETFTAKYLLGSTTDSLYIKDFELSEDAPSESRDNATYDIVGDEPSENEIIIEDTSTNEESSAVDEVTPVSEDGVYTISYKEYLDNKDKYVKLSYDETTKIVTVRDKKDGE